MPHNNRASVREHRKTEQLLFHASLHSELRPSLGHMQGAKQGHSICSSSRMRTRVVGWLPMVADQTQYNKPNMGVPG